MSNDLGLFTAVNAISREASFLWTWGTCHIIGTQGQKLLFCDVAVGIPGVMGFFCKSYYWNLHKQRKVGNLYIFYVL